MVGTGANGTAQHNSYPQHIQFGSDSFANASYKNNHADAAPGTGTDRFDGSHTFVIKPQGDDNSRVGFTGNKFTIKSVHARLNFFSTTSASSTITNGTTQLWSQESIIDVYLILEKKPRIFITGAAENLSYINAKTMFLPADNTIGLNYAREFVNSFLDRDNRNYFTVLKHDRMELAPGSDNAEAYHPYNFYKNFAKGLECVVDTDILGSKVLGSGVGVTKNRLQVVCVARGAVGMTGEIRVKFCDN